MTWLCIYMRVHFLNIDYIVEHLRTAADAGCLPSLVLLQTVGAL